MSERKLHIVYTIGHSTHTIDEFIEMLKEAGIEMLVDIRHFPGSRKFPQFNKENLEKSLPSAGINYLHLVDLGGRRKPLKNSHNTRWHNESFMGYADYMETDTFKKAIIQIEEIAAAQKTAIMCSEALWWRCHRSMVSDWLKSKQWTVWHIMSKNKIEEHHYTSPARIVNGELVYYDNRSSLKNTGSN